MIRIDFIAALLAVCISIPGIASVFPYLDAVAKTAAVSASVTAFFMVRKQAVFAGSLPTVLSILAFIAYGMQISLADPVGPAVNLLAVLLAVRLLSEKTVRHHLQVAALSLFTLAASSLFELGPMFLAYLALLLVLIPVLLVVLTFCVATPDLALEKRGLKRVFSFSLLLPAATLPLIFLFFVIMPRTQYPLWNFLNRGQPGTTGMSDEVRPGSTPNVAAAKTPAFRATMPEIDRNLLYWRGIVLNSLRDGSWQREDPPEPAAGPVRGGSSVRMTMLPQPQRGRYLVTLDLPVRLDGVFRARQHPDAVYSMPAPVEKRARYDVTAIPGGVLTVGKGIDREFYLRLPENLSPRMLALAKQIAAGRDAGEKLARAEQYFRDARFRYGTSGLPTGERALDTFLFEQRVGHCELFASSLAVLLRASGVPCRLVGGYYGGSYNELGGYYLVTEDMAHLWVEAFIEEEGWVRVDPSSWSAGFGSLERNAAGLASMLRLWADTLEYSWNMAIVSYDLERQIRLFRETGERVRRLDAPKSVPALVVYGIGVLAATGAAVLWVRRHRWPSREERILRAFLAVLRKRYGIVNDEPSAGLHDLAARVGIPAVDEFVAIYSGTVYRDRKLSDEEYRRLKELIK